MILIAVASHVAFAAVAGLIGGGLTMLAGKALLKQTPGYGNAFKANFFAALVVAFIRLVAGLMVSPEDMRYVSLWLVLVGFLALMLMLRKQLGYTLGQSAAVAGEVCAFYLIASLLFVVVVTGAMAVSGATAGA